MIIGRTPPSTCARQLLLPLLIVRHLRSFSSRVLRCVEDTKSKNSLDGCCTQKQREHSMDDTKPKHNTSQRCARIQSNKVLGCEQNHAHDGDIQRNEQQAENRIHPAHYVLAQWLERTPRVILLA
jgi:hypothetical protein